MCGRDGRPTLYRWRASRRGDADVSQFGRVDVLVNNAGVETRASGARHSRRQYDRALSITPGKAFYGAPLAAGGDASLALSSLSGFKYSALGAPVAVKPGSHVRRGKSLGPLERPGQPRCAARPYGQQRHSAGSP
jgi:NAD(P)-dependent dehydrogenase (short-subunit alcohol dehydrogenase family)